ARIQRHPWPKPRLVAHPYVVHNNAVASNRHTVADDCAAANHRVLADGDTPPDTRTPADPRRRCDAWQNFLFGIKSWQQSNQLFLRLVDDDSRRCTALDVAEFGIDQHDAGVRTSHQGRVLGNAQQAQIGGACTIEWSYSAD